MSKTPRQPTTTVKISENGGADKGDTRFFPLFRKYILRKIQIFRAILGTTFKNFDVLNIILQNYARR